MKNKKAAGPSAGVAEILKAVPDICCKIIVGLTDTIILMGKVPEDWSDSIIVSLFKGKADALDLSRCRGRKLTDHVLKVIERLIKDIIQGTVIISETQFGLFLVEEQQMQFLFLVSFKRSILQNTRNCMWHLLIWKSPSPSASRGTVVGSSCHWGTRIVIASHV